MKKLLKIILLGIVLPVCIFLLYVQLSYRQSYQAPMTGIVASKDSTIVARGKYLVLGAAHCYTCHMPDSLQEKGINERMVGGYKFSTPFATFHTPNLTSDPETGTGRFTDEQLARAVRYSINHKDLAMVGFMSYNAMSDNDLQAIISYLRVVPPVRNVVPEHEYNMLGKILMRFLLKPVENPMVQNVKPDTTAEYGSYLAYNVTNCNGCHTKRDGVGKFGGKPMAGGGMWDYDDAIYRSPNLTFNDSTGRIVKWSAQQFIDRFRAGKLLPHTPMPWEAYKHLSDRDLLALYNFMKSLPPVHNEVQKTYEPKSSAITSAK